MKLADARTIAGVIPEDEREAVADAAIATGVARRERPPMPGATTRLEASPDACGHRAWRGLRRSMAQSRA
jgi:hypothetical protein